MIVKDLMKHLGLEAGDTITVTQRGLELWRWSKEPCHINEKGEIVAFTRVQENIVFLLREDVKFYKTKERVQRGTPYFYINETGVICERLWENDCDDIMRYKIGNFYLEDEFTVADKEKWTAWYAED